MMNGGPSHVDTFDYKPSLAKYAGQTLPPEKQFTNSGGRKMGFLTPAWRPFRPGGESGLMISDYFPRVREHADKLALIRSCHTDSHAHGSALVAMNTGSTFIGRPSLGSWAVYGLGTMNENLPGYVAIMDKRGGPISGQPNWAQRLHAGQFSGNAVSAGRRAGARSARAGRLAKSQREQLDLLAELNQEHLDAAARRRRSWPRGFKAMSWPTACRPKRPRRWTWHKKTSRRSTCTALAQQPTDEFGRNCLVARRLVERGVRFVQLYSGGGHLEDTWDAHESVEKNHGRHGAEVDQPIAGAADRSRTPRLARQHAGAVGRRVRPHAVCRRGRAPRAAITIPTASRCGWPAAA